MDVLTFLQDALRSSHVAHVFLWSTGGSGGWGGCDNVLDEYNTWPTELVAVVDMLHMLSYGQQGVVGGGGV